MSKNKKNAQVEIIEPDIKAKNNKAAAKTNTKLNKKPKKERKSLIKKLKEIFSELKKVSWPTFGKTCRQTLVVITVVLICTLVLFGIDRLLSLVYNLLIG